MRCPSCGGQVSEGHAIDGHCPNCGARMVTDLSSLDALPDSLVPWGSGRNDMTGSGPAEPVQAGGTHFPQDQGPAPTGNVLSRFFRSLGSVLGLARNAVPGQSRHQDTGHYLPTSGTSGRQNQTHAVAGHATGMPSAPSAPAPPAPPAAPSASPTPATPKPAAPPTPRTPAPRAPAVRVPAAPAVPPTPKAPPSPDEVIDAEAEKRGVSGDELKEQLGLPTSKGTSKGGTRNTSAYWEPSTVPGVYRMMAPAGDPVVNVDGEHLYVINPFVSEDQRRYLWANEPDIAHAWAHGEHTSEEDHRMPGETGADVAGPLAEAERKAQKKGKGKGKATVNQTGNAAPNATPLSDLHDSKAFSDHAHLLGWRAQQASLQAKDDETNETAHEAHKDAADAHAQAAERARRGADAGDGNWGDDGVPGSPGAPGVDYTAARYHDAQAVFHNDKASQHFVRAGKGKPGEPYKLLQGDSPGVNRRRTGTSPVNRPSNNRTTPVTNRRTTNNQDEEECPRCGGEMVDGECEECGYVENRRPVGNEFKTDDERKAAFAHMDDAGGAKSAEATTASRSAAQKKTPESHAAAARAHQAAASQHAGAGNLSLAKKHRLAAAEHKAKAKSLTGNRGRMRTSNMTDVEADWWSRQPPLRLSRLITANCGGPGSGVPGPCKGGAVSRGAAAASAKASDAESHGAAASAHDSAAQAHEAHAAKAREAGKEKVAQAHEALAKGHRDQQATHQQAQSDHSDTIDLGGHEGPSTPSSAAFSATEHAGGTNSTTGTADAHQAAGKAHWDAMKAAPSGSDAQHVHQQYAKMHFGAAKSLGGGKKPTGNRDRYKQSRTTRGATRVFNRDTTIDYLVTNCSCWGNSRDQLEAMSDGQLRFLTRMARNAKPDSSNADVLGTGPGDVRVGGVDEEGSDTADDYTDEDSDFPEKAARGVGKGTPGRATPTGNGSLVDLLRQSEHPDDQRIAANIEYAGRLVDEKRKELINRLTSRIEDARLRRAMVQNYSGKSTEELELFAMTLPAEAQSHRPPRPLFSGVSGSRDPLYFGGAGGGVFNRQTVEDRGDFLDLPKMDWGNSDDN